MNGSFQTDLLKTSEVDALLHLQKENLKSNISEQTAVDQGFLTFQFSDEFVLHMMKDMPQPIAKANDEIVGYAFASTINSTKNHPLFIPLIDLCNTLTINGKPSKDFKYYFMGQICVKDGWRNKGVFDALYQKHKELFSNTYDFVLTEISVYNKRSMAAHQRVGFKTIHQYTENNNVWDVVMWDWK